MIFGTLQITAGESSLEECGTVLARCQSTGDPLGRATQFLRNKDLGDGDFIQVEGTSGSVGPRPVFCMTDAAKATAESAARSVAAMRRAARERRRS